jgi:nucleotide-binding universal stress UspA family protein
MPDRAGRPIVVGVDGSADSTRAARWAAEEARLRGGAVNVVHVYSWPMPPDPLVSLPPEWTQDSVRRAAEVIVDQVVDDVGDRRVAVTGVAVPGVAPYKLVELSEGADLVVVGHRGHGWFAPLQLGSVAAKVAAHAACPVAVIRGDHDDAVTAGPVLAGVDGSPASDAAVGFAFGEADRRKAALTLLHAWEPLRPPARAPASPEDRLRKWARPWRQKYPDVSVEEYVTTEQPAAALLEAARDTTLLVVGSRGRGGFAGLLLGSVSQQMIHHAACPVIIVR